MGLCWYGHLPDSLPHRHLLFVKNRIYIFLNLMYNIVLEQYSRYRLTQIIIDVFD
jgi:hypothetical protein